MLPVLGRGGWFSSFLRQDKNKNQESVCLAVSSGGADYKVKEDGCDLIKLLSVHLFLISALNFSLGARKEKSVF